jgi:rhodanese-related sulfurtransferase
MSAAATALPSVTPRQLDELRRQGAEFELIDVRTPGEFRGVHAEPARNVPLDQLYGPQLAELAEQSRRRPVYVICQSGGRSRSACEKLLSAGADKIHNVDGGTTAWEAAGLPVVRGRGAISM